MGFRNGIDRACPIYYFKPENANLTPSNVAGKAFSRRETTPERLGSISSRNLASNAMAVVGVDDGGAQ